MTLSNRFVVAEGASLDSEVGKAINARYLAPETEVVRSLADLARLPEDRRAAVQRRALALVNAVRGAKRVAAGSTLSCANITLARARASSSCVSRKRCCAFRMPRRQIG
ncbi:MAG: hypothetical protein WDO56_25615 [Gammaproteobacteria bacterium]